MNNEVKTTEVKEVKKPKLVWIIIGFVMAPLGGIVGLWIGSKYAYGNYDRLTKILGWLMIIISIVSVRMMLDS